MKFNPAEKNRAAESGNVMFFILLAIVLIGLVTAAIRMGGMDNANIDNERATVIASRVKQYAGELERAANFIFSNTRLSEEDIRFGHANAPADYGVIGPDDEDRVYQLFHTRGGGAEYAVPNGDANDGSPWEFFGVTALPEVGTDRADLVAVLPNMNETVCGKLNEMAGYDAGVTPDMSASTCIRAADADRFDDAHQFEDPAYVIGVADTATFTVRPAMEACVKCGVAFHYYHVLKAR